jgi:hypothetical protein
LLAANLHIALNQERALIDPSHKKDPKQSGYARTVANLASLYAAYVRATGPSVRELRMRQISTLKKREEVKPSAFGGCDALRYSWTFWFEDANKGYHSANYHYSDIAGQCDPIDYKKVRKKELDAQTALNEYVKKVGDEIDSYLESKVYGVADSWERLAKNPIPKLSD